MSIETKLFEFKADLDQAIKSKSMEGFIGKTLNEPLAALIFTMKDFLSQLIPLGYLGEPQEMDSDIAYIINDKENRYSLHYWTSEREPHYVVTLFWREPDYYPQLEIFIDKKSIIQEGQKGIEFGTSEELADFIFNFCPVEEKIQISNNLIKILEFIMTRKPPQPVVQELSDNLRQIEVLLLKLLNQNAKK